MPLQLAAEDLSVARGGRVLFSGLSFAVAAGETLLLTGPNGAGKTSLLRVLAGFLPAAQGRVVLRGGDAELDLAQQCHWIGHANAVKPALTALENARFWARYLGGSDAAAEAALDRFGLGALGHIPAGYMSAGQKRRLGLSRLLVAERPVWLLDEPTVSLDADSTAVLAEVVRGHVAAGGLAIAATHLPLGLAGARELRLGHPAERHEV